MVQRAIFCALLVCILVSGACSAQVLPPRSSINVGTVEKDTYIGFYCQSADYFHGLLIFRVADKQSGKWNTAPIVHLQGRTAFITLDEMRALVEKNIELDPPWLFPKQNFPQMDAAIRNSTGNLEITVYDTKLYGRRDYSMALLNPSKLCSSLASLDSALTTPRARWEFQLYRVAYKCNVPGFNRDAYANRDDPTLPQGSSR